jgi:hypothetical protein
MSIDLFLCVSGGSSGLKIPDSDLARSSSSPKLSFFYQGCRFSELGVEDTAEAHRQTLQCSSLSIQVQSVPVVVNRQRKSRQQRMKSWP